MVFGHVFGLSSQIFWLCLKYLRDKKEQSGEKIDFNQGRGNELGSSKRRFGRKLRTIHDQQYDTFFWLLVILFIEMIYNFIYESIWMFTLIKDMIFILNLNLISLGY